MYQSIIKPKGYFDYAVTSMREIKQSTMLFESGSSDTCPLVSLIISGFPTVNPEETSICPATSWTIGHSSNYRPLVIRD